MSSAAEIESTIISLDAKMQEEENPAKKQNDEGGWKAENPMYYREGPR